MFKEVKARAVQQGVTLKALLTAYVEAGLRGSSVSNDAATPGGKHHPLPVGIPRMPDAPLHPAMTNAELCAILDAEDFGEYKRAICNAPFKLERLLKENKVGDSHDQQDQTQAYARVQSRNRS